MMRNSCNKLPANSLTPEFHLVQLNIIPSVAKGFIENRPDNNIRHKGSNIR